MYGADMRPPRAFKEARRLLTARQHLLPHSDAARPGRNDCGQIRRLRALAAAA